MFIYFSFIVFYVNRRSFLRENITRRRKSDVRFCPRRTTHFFFLERISSKQFGTENDLYEARRRYHLHTFFYFQPIPLIFQGHVFYGWRPSYETVLLNVLLLILFVSLSKRWDGDVYICVQYLARHSLNYV